MKNLVVNLKSSVNDDVMMEKYGCLTFVVFPGVTAASIMVISSTIDQSEKNMHIFYDSGLKVYIKSSSGENLVNNGDSALMSVLITNQTEKPQRLWFDNMYEASRIEYSSRDIQLLMHDTINRLKYIKNLNTLKIINCASALNVNDFSIEYSLTRLILAGLEAYGDLGTLKNQVSLENLDVSYMTGNVTLDISSLSKLTKLKTLKVFTAPYSIGYIDNLSALVNLVDCELYESNIQGDISVAFGKSIVMTKLLIRDTNVGGSLEDLMQAQINAGRISGVLDVSGSKTNITFNGKPARGHLYIHFDTQTITTTP